jgi:hypothetical protein
MKIDNARLKKFEVSKVKKNEYWNELKRDIYSNNLIRNVKPLEVEKKKKEK